MSVSPEDPKKIRQRIRSYERKLQAEKQTHGQVMDGGGRRYLIGPLYLLLGDLEGAVKAFAWFDKEFPDDGGEPGHLLCWALALHRAGQEEKASGKLREAMLLNLYLLPHLLGIKTEPLAIWHGSNMAEKDYLEWIPPEFFALWDEEALAWAKRLYGNREFQAVEARYIEIHGDLLHLRPGAKRTRLVNEASSLRGWKG